MATKFKRLWVSSGESMEEGWRIRAVEFDDDDSEHAGGPNRRGFTGPLAFINHADSKVKHVQLGLVHVFGQGWLWYLVGEAPPLEPPFLATSDLSTRLVFSGEITIEAEGEIQMLIEGMGVGQEWPVRCENWFGIARVVKCDQETRVFLWAFADCPSVRVQFDESLDLIGSDGSVHIVRGQI